MKLPESTEWVLHCATSLAQLPPGGTASAAQLARYFDVPQAYLAKQLQALVRAGILAGTTGPRGGFRLARPAAAVTVLDLVEAVDGAAAPYVCNEIRQRGVGALPAADCRKICPLAAVMADANRAWRRTLDDLTLADIVAGLPRTAPARTARLLARARDAAQPG